MSGQTILKIILYSVMYGLPVILFLLWAYFKGKDKL